MEKRPRAPSDTLSPDSDAGVHIEQIYIEIEPEIVFEEGKVIKQEPECEEELPDDCSLSETDYCGEKVKDDRPLSPELLPPPDWPALPLDGGWANVEEKQFVPECVVKIERIKEEEEPLNELSLSQQFALRDCEVRLARVSAAGPGRAAQRHTEATAMYTEPTPYSRFCTLMEHERIHPRVKTKHTGEKPYSCTICKGRFTRPYHLKIHNQIHTGEKPYPCKICKRSFANLHNLKTHIRIHTGEKPYACKVCKSCFTDPSALKRHNRIHTGEKPYPCKICKKSFAHLLSLKIHNRIHTGEKPYPCPICNKSFKDSSSLKRHNRIHTGEKPYSCEICEKSFMNSFTLTRHNLIHTGEKPYPCEICERSFTTSFHLKRHNQIHTGENHIRAKYVTRGLRDPPN